MEKEQICNFVLLMFLFGLLIEWSVGMLYIKRLEIAGVSLLLNAIAVAIAVGLTIHFKAKFKKTEKLQVADDAGRVLHVRGWWRR